ncbi:MAG: hypothetical protein M3Q97_01395 [Bacteroidota bacterium]|nr:hypothetical protein [Bacteroidota bacterium]
MKLLRKFILPFAVLLSCFSHAQQPKTILGMTIGFEGMVPQITEQDSVNVYAGAPGFSGLTGSFRLGAHTRLNVGMIAAHRALYFWYNASDWQLDNIQYMDLDLFYLDMPVSWALNLLEKRAVDVYVSFGASPCFLTGRREMSYYSSAWLWKPTKIYDEKISPFLLYTTTTFGTRFKTKNYHFGAEVFSRRFMTTMNKDIFRGGLNAYSFAFGASAGIYYIIR